ncbi:hypothetical protein [Rasiella sp. SM2506]
MKERKETKTELDTLLENSKNKKNALKKLVQKLEENKKSNSKPK